VQLPKISSVGRLFILSACLALYDAIRMFFDPNYVFDLFGLPYSEAHLFLSKFIGMLYFAISLTCFSLSVDKESSVLWKFVTIFCFFDFSIGIFVIVSILTGTIAPTAVFVVFFYFLIGGSYLYYLNSSHKCMTG
jgi:ABC-type transport system involved in multi-copper enzyme maturation permease subunit